METIQREIIKIQSILFHRRYLLILLLFGLVLLFGNNFTSNDKAYLPAASPVFGYDVSLSKDQPKYLISNFQPFDGDRYRLTFGAYLTSKDDVANNHLRLALIDATDNDKKLSIGEIDLKKNSLEPQEFIFTATNLVNSIEIEAPTITEAELIFLKEIVLTRLNSNGVDRYEPTQFDGRYRENPIINNNTSDDVVADFMKSDQEIGQTFMAKSDNISSLVLNVHFLGNGGVGEYQLTLREATKTNEGNIIISPDSLANLNFSSRQAQDWYAIPNGENLIRFPLTARLQTGKTYFFGIRNSGDFNLLNHLRFSGSKDNSYVDGECVQVDHNGTGTPIGGDLSFQALHIPDPQQASRALRIEDLGGGRGVFSYSTKNYLSGFDLIESDSNYRIYKIDLNHKYWNIKLNIFEDKNNFEVSLSTDSQHWQLVDGTRGNYLSTIIGDSSLYVKIRKNDIIEENWSDFALNGNLEIK